MIERLGRRVPRIAPSAWIHPAACVVGDVEIGEGSSVWPGAVLRGDFGPIRIGAGTSIQDNAVIHAGEPGTAIGDDCIVGHLAFVENARVGNRCLIGVGARVLNGCRLHDGAAAAAGAVLAGGLEVRGGERAQGVPARVVAAGDALDDYVSAGAASYREMAQRHRREARRLDA